MILTKKELRFYIAADRLMAGKTERIRFKERLRNLLNPDHILNYLKAMRKVAYYKNTKKKGSLNYYYYQRAYTRLGIRLGFSIDPNSFGYGLLIPHYGTIVINSDTKAGNYCVLHTSTCIGGSGKVIGHGLYLASGAQIMGAELTLGENISIGSNSMVNKSFEASNVLLTGSPATIKKKTSAWYDRDGEVYAQRVKAVETLLHKYSGPS
ncbi:serine acetyltransferase [Aggregatimonas sangjinii]|uniref:Serine acetyltransferase n=1 Tax=Aggregatimonas sangjinii TaxID=2583587 RepID=A0A5B7SY04_9FLAO|nr:serine acetyltransferase [Aggregatimonas sangjinii]QCX01654.1 serine acetyltransferase [Aggregatimonas sangjinii]